jgi:hypothetical protein
MTLWGVFGWLFGLVYGCLGGLKLQVAVGNPPTHPRVGRSSSLFLAFLKRHSSVSSTPQNAGGRDTDGRGVRGFGWRRSRSGENDQAAANARMAATTRMVVPSTVSAAIFRWSLTNAGTTCDRCLPG